MLVELPPHSGLQVPQHELKYVLISRSNIISLQTHADHLSDQQSKRWNTPACQQGVLMAYTPSQIICQRLLGVLCCPKRCWKYLWLRPLDAAGQLEDRIAPADRTVRASTLNFPDAFYISNLLRTLRPHWHKYIKALLKIKPYNSLSRCQRILPDTMTGEWEHWVDSDMLVSSNIKNILGNLSKLKKTYKLLAKQANYQWHQILFSG